MSRKKTLLLGTLILTATGFLTRLIGFFYRIFLSQTIGARELGIFQLLSPVTAICSAVCIGGISTVMSRTIAARSHTGEKKEGFQIFLSGSLFCVSLSCAAAFFVHTCSDFLAVRILREPECAPLLSVLSYAIPLSALHVCAAAYYYGRKKTGVPAAGQLIEQLVRVAASYLLYCRLLQQGQRPDAMLTVLGLLAGEAASCLFTVSMLAADMLRQRVSPLLRRSSLCFTRELVALSLPLTANRICITLLHSVESILIPGRLRASGLSGSEALSTYGVMTGMALPMILFPGALTNSLAVMLLPSIAEDEAAGNRARVRRTIELTIRYCMILGIFSSGFFFVYGRKLGTLLFKNEEAGIYLQILAFISPFLYLNSTLSGVLNGLGKTRQCFYESTAGLSIRILFVLGCVPLFGIRGYLWGILASELASTLLILFFLRRAVPFGFDALSCLLKPAAALLLSVGVSFFATGILGGFLISPGIPAFAAASGAMALSYLAFLFWGPLLNLRGRKG